MEIYVRFSTRSINILISSYRVRLINYAKKKLRFISSYVANYLIKYTGEIKTTRLAFYIKNIIKEDFIIILDIIWKQDKFWNSSVEIASECENHSLLTNS